MLTLVFGLFGLIVGRFLNVVILRFGEKSIRGRSACPHCGAQLRALDMVPVLSWLFLRGRCRYCGGRISAQYPLVEATTGLLFAGIGGAAMPLISTLLALPIAALLICIFTYDLRHKLIPDIWVWVFVALALTSAFSFQLSATSFLAGPVAAAPILFLWYLSRPFTGEAGQWMGFGDVKLSLGIGWLLGFPLGFIAIFLAFIIGAIISVCILLPLPMYIRWWHRVKGLAHAARLASLRPVGADGTREDVHGSSLPTGGPMSDHANLGAGYTMKSEVPFGPFLIIACLIVWFAVMYNVQIPLLW